MKVKLEELVEEVSERTTVNNQHPVLTSSRSGIYLQEEYFKKQVASKDNTGYRVIRKGEFTYRAMSDTGEFYPNKLECIDIGIVSPAYPVFKIRDNRILPDYLKYYFKSRSFQKSITAFVQGSTRASMKFGKMKLISIDLPDKDKQNQILNIIRILEGIIDKYKLEIDCLNNLIKARFVEMFGNVVVNDKSWPTKPISSVAPASSPKITVSENIWLLNLDMIESQSGKVLDRIIVSKNKINASTCAFDDKNVLYSKLRPYLNKVVLPDQEGYCTTELVPLRPSNKLNREFLATLLRSDAFVGYINEKTAGAKMPRVSMNIFRQFECILPPITLQEQFSVFYKQVDKSKFALSNELAMCNFYVRLINDSITHSRIDLRMSE